MAIIDKSYICSIFTNMTYTPHYNNNWFKCSISSCVIFFVSSAYICTMLPKSNAEIISLIFVLVFLSITSFIAALWVRKQQLTGFKFYLMADTDRKTLTKMFNRLPDAVLLLSSAKDKPVNKMIDADLSLKIKYGNVGFDHYNLDYSN